ncbi:MAG: DNA polymerase III subunit gamma/tau [Chloroflexota bacterium]
MSSVIPSDAHRALYRRWRAQTFSQIVGQGPVVETLRNAVRTDRVAHAILFVGPRGTGKTSLARILAKAVNCTDLRDGDPCDACSSCVSIREGTTLDLVEIDAASNRGIDDVRGLRERLAYPPGQLRRKVYILDEAHQLTPPAWNALLKSIEEPPEFVIFMFASTDPSGFPPAILSRLQRYDVRHLTIPEIEGKLTRILEADGREAEPEAIALIARLAAGGMRDAESMLDQLLSSGTDRIEAGQVRDLLGLADGEAVASFVDALIRADAAAGVDLLDRLEERGRGSRAFLDQVVEALRTELVDPVRRPADGSHSTAALAAAAHRLAAIDPSRPGIGGLRLQLELALFAVGDRPSPAGSMAPIAPAPGKPEEVTVAAAGVAPPSRPEPRQPPQSARPSPDAVPAVAGARAARTAPPGGEATAPAGEDAAAPARGAPVDADLAGVLASWPAMIAAVSQHPPSKPLIAACRPISIDGAVITLGFPEEQAFLRDHAERKRGVFEEGIGSVLGRPVAVRFVVANLELAPPLPVEAEASFVMAEAKRIFADDLVDVTEVS